MEIKHKKSLLLISVLVTVVVLLSMLLFASFLENGRKEYLNEEMSAVQSQIRELQTFDTMSDSFGPEMACLVAQRSLEELDENIWDLGIRLENYEQASSDLYDDPFYKEQKRMFNEQQIRYMSMIQQVENNCDVERTIVAYFYRNDSACDKCNDQSFVLGDLNEQYGEQLSMFAYDLDLNSTSLDLLAKYYGVDRVPCLVIEGETTCGMQGQRRVESRLCSVDSPPRFCYD